MPNNTFNISHWGFAIAIFGLTSLPSHTIAQDATGRIDSFFTALYKDKQINGNVLIAEQGKPVYRKSFGYANLENETLNNDASVFDLASISKLFTSVAVLQLKERGRLKLDAPLVKYLPDFPFPEITIRQLLSHTSGLPDFELFDSYIKQDSNRIIKNADIIPILKASRKLLFKPGEKWNYSSPGMGLLALLVERISGLSFEDYLTKYVWKPARMYNTHINSRLAPLNDKNLTGNYDLANHFSSNLIPSNTTRDGKWFLQVAGGMQGPGLVVSTTQDLLLFDQALYSGKLLSQATQTEAFTPTRLNNGEPAYVNSSAGRTYIGLGWMIMADSSAGKIVYHSGFRPGGSTIFLRNITRRHTVIMLDNTASFGLHANGVNVMHILDNTPMLVLKKSLAETYAKDLVTRGADFAASRFHELRSDTAHYQFSGGQMDFIAHEFLFTGYHEQALEMLKLLTFLEPQKSPPFNSYGEVLEKTGKKEAAILMYRRTLLLNPDNQRAREAIQRLVAH